MTAFVPLWRFTQGVAIMFIMMASVLLADVCPSGAPAHVYMSIAIASVLLVAVVFLLIALSLDTLRRVSEYDSQLELFEADNSFDS